MIFAVSPLKDVFKLTALSSEDDKDGMNPMHFCCDNRLNVLQLMVPLNGPLQFGGTGGDAINL